MNPANGATPALPEVLSGFAAYRAARVAFLALLTLPRSNRDPLAEFSERLVAGLTGGQVHQNPVNKGHDVLVGAGGLRVQVKYLANAAERRVNNHPLRVIADMDHYALVVFASLEPLGVLVFPVASIPAVYTALGKRHGAKYADLDLTPRDIRRFLAQPDAYTAHGVAVILPPFAAHSLILTPPAEAI